MPVVFLDVETPNRRNDKVCSMGVIRIDDEGGIEYQEHVYIDPESPFDTVNIGIHGVRPSDVMGAKTIGSYWKSELSSVLRDSILVAHNALFDLTVLDKALAHYDITFDQVDYICTKKAAESSGLAFEKFSLPSVCSGLGIEFFNHHNALSDARACMSVFQTLRERRYIDLFCTSVYSHVDYQPGEVELRSPNTSMAMTELYGIVLGMAADNVIDSREVSALTSWMNQFSAYKTQPVFKEAFRLLGQSISDGIITEHERDSLLSFSRPFVSDGHSTRRTAVMQELIGIIKGISADRKISSAEAFALRWWLQSNEDLKDDKQFSKVLTAVTNALHDSFISPEEETQLLLLFDSISNPVKSTARLGCEMDGRMFCLTGDFEFGQKNEVSDYIQSNGGSISKSVTRKCDYVVVGGRGSDRFAYGSYGSKVKKAMELQDSGYPIEIIQEADLFNAAF